MSLLTTARALDDQRFLWRIRAAVMCRAITEYESTNEESKALAREVLDIPMQQNSTFEALVACDPVISTKCVADADSAISTEAVTDEDIESAVASYWPTVASRRAEIRGI